MLTIRTRDYELRSSGGSEGWKSKTHPVLDFEVPFHRTLTGTQYTESEGHPFPKRGSSEDLGGEFLTSKLSYKDNCKRVKVWQGPPGEGFFWDGTCFPHLESGSDLSSFLTVVHSSDSELDAAGSTAISRVLPTNPVAGLAVAFGELREGFPKIIGSTLFKKSGKPVSSKAGDEYLNYQFGWAPMVSDFKKWLNAVRDADKIWKQFQRDAGRHVRRRYYFPETTEVILDDELAGQPVKGGPVFGSLWQGGTASSFKTLYRHHEIKRQRWFSGAFMYYMDTAAPSMKMWNSDMQRLQKLYGVKITPEVIWNLTPWSWAADWFGNTGDVIRNISQFSSDGLVMPYGYMMEKSVMTATYRMRDVTLQGLTIPDITQEFTKTVKRRRKATPFGFGLDFDSFSQFQLSIIAALGLSRRG